MPGFISHNCKRDGFFGVYVNAEFGRMPDLRLRQESAQVSHHLRVVSAPTGHHDLVYCERNESLNTCRDGSGREGCRSRDEVEQRQARLAQLLYEFTAVLFPSRSLRRSLAIEAATQQAVD